MRTVIGYHFTSSVLRNRQPIPAIGEWLEHAGPVVPCESGLHASEHPLDALNYAPGARLHRVELEGDLVSHGSPVDKWVGRRRKIVATIDATSLLREFARRCALSVIDKWDAPQVVRDYLTTGDESLRDAAWDAVWAARAASQAASQDAAWDAAWDASQAASQDASQDAAWDAAWAASRAASQAASQDAAWDAAWAASRADQRAKFAEMVDAAFAAGTVLGDER